MGKRRWKGTGRLWNWKQESGSRAPAIVLQWTGTLPFLVVVSRSFRVLLIHIQQFRVQAKLMMMILSLSEFRQKDLEKYKSTRFKSLNIYIHMINSCIERENGENQGEGDLQIRKKLLASGNSYASVTLFMGLLRNGESELWNCRQ